jgi:hypothetical protein
MTAKEAIAIVEKATEGNAECQIAIDVIRREITDWQNEVEKLWITLEKAAAKLVAEGLM